MSPLIMVDCFVSEPSPWCLRTRTVHPPRRGRDGFCSRFNNNLNNKEEGLSAVTETEAAFVQVNAGTGSSSSRLICIGNS